MNLRNNDIYLCLEKLKEDKDIDLSILETFKKFLIERGLEKVVLNDAIDVMNSIIEVKINEFMKKFSTNEFISDKDKSNLGININISNSYSNSIIKNEDGSISIYPSLNITSHSFTKAVSLYLIENHKSFNNSIEEINDIIKKQNEEIYKKLCTAKVRPYHGSPSFIYNRVRAIYDGMKLINDEKLSKDERIIFNKEVSNVMPIIKRLLNEIRNISNIDLTDLVSSKPFGEPIVSKESYDSIINDFEKVLEVENKLKFISSRLWNEFMSKNGLYLSHALTGEIVKPEDMSKVCTSLNSGNDFKNLYGGNVGYLYDMDPSHVISVCPDDVGSFYISKEKFFKNGINIRNQLDDTNITYEQGYQSSLLTAKYLYEMSRQHLDSNTNHTEIVFLNKDKELLPTKAYYTETATQDEIQKIKQIALEKNIPLEKMQEHNSSNFSIK